MAKKNTKENVQQKDLIYFFHKTTEILTFLLSLNVHHTILRAMILLKQKNTEMTCFLNCHQPQK